MAPQTRRIATQAAEKDLLSKSLEAFSLQNTAGCIIGRDEEMQALSSAIDAGFNKNKGGVVYLSGVPGTGKTATTMKVLTAYEDKKNVKIVYSNGVQVSKPASIYSSLLKDITGDKRHRGWEKSRNILTEHFGKRRARAPYTILFVDEIDFLLTGKGASFETSQQVLYTLLDWSSLATSKLLLIAISNTMDLPKRLLGKSQSRLGVSENITFRPYSTEQCKMIVSQRLIDFKCEGAWAPQAAALAAGKVSSVSGDARELLGLCRNATAIAMDQKSKVTVQIVNESQTRFQSTLAELFSSLPYAEKIVFLCIMALVTPGLSSSASVSKVVTDFRILVTANREDIIYDDDIWEAAMDGSEGAVWSCLGTLQQMGLVSLYYAPPTSNVGGPCHLPQQFTLDSTTTFAMRCSLPSISKFLLEDPHISSLCKSIGLFHVGAFG